MGFVGGGGDIAIVSAIPLSSLLIVVVVIAYGYSTFKILLVPETSVSGC